ncbi:MAG TPA: hypothetical protein VF812_02130 [Ktedonobacterales bacterium]
MATLLVTLPIKAGQADAARAFAAECVGRRFADYDASERRIGIPMENWYLQRVGGSEYFVIVLDGPDLNASLGAFIGSHDPFDLWFKERMLEISGVDLNAGPPPADAMAETLAQYSVGMTAHA